MVGKLGSFSIISNFEILDLEYLKKKLTTKNKQTKDKRIEKK